MSRKTLSMFIFLEPHELININLFSIHKLHEQINSCSYKYGYMKDPHDIIISKDKIVKHSTGKVIIKLTFGIYTFKPEIDMELECCIDLINEYGIICKYDTTIDIHIEPQNINKKKGDMINIKITDIRFIDGTFKCLGKKVI